MLVLDTDQTLIHFCSMHFPSISAHFICDSATEGRNGPLIGLGLLFSLGPHSQLPRWNTENLIQGIAPQRTVLLSLVTAEAKPFAKAHGFSTLPCSSVCTPTSLTQAGRAPSEINSVLWGTNKPKV